MHLSNERVERRSVGDLKVRLDVGWARLRRVRQKGTEKQTLRAWCLGRPEGRPLRPDLS